MKGTGALQDCKTAPAHRCIDSVPHRWSSGWLASKGNHQTCFSAQAVIFVEQRSVAIDVPAHFGELAADGVLRLADGTGTC